MKFSNITTLIVPFLLLCGCEEKTPVENPPVVEQVITQPEKLTPEQELEKLQKEAEAGDATAQFKLGEKFYIGKDVPRDRNKALEWYEKSANQNFIDAQIELGNLLEMGLPREEIKARDWYQKGAIQGNAKAQLELGKNFCGDNRSEFPDHKKGIEWIQKSVNQGYADAQFELGQLYRWNLCGIDMNYSEAAKWFQKAVDQNHKEAQYELGRMFEEGIGVPKNLMKAAELYQNIAVYIGSNVEMTLGKMYLLGKGVTQDKVKAYALFNLAASDNTDYFAPSAKEKRDYIEKYLTSSEILEAQKLSSKWKTDGKLSDLSDNQKESANSHQPNKQKYGTAIIVSKDGYALTNHHVVNGCNEIKIAERNSVAKLVTSDGVNDIALLQLPNNNDNFAKINPEPNKLRQGEDVVVFGYPLNSVLSSGGNLTLGTISALSGLNNNTNQIQITAPIQPGSSGSPVMDQKGDIVGIVSMKLDDTKMAKATGSIGQTVNFAVNGQTVKTFLDTNNVQYKTGGGFFSMEKNNADIAEEAKKWTVLVECWK